MCSIPPAKRYILPCWLLLLCFRFPFLPSASGNCIKCFFGNYWACPGKTAAEKPEEPQTAVLGQCTGYAKNCKIADILNSDGTCTSDKVSGKTPIGVVVYIGGGSDKCGYAMTASPIATDIAWGKSDTDIPSLVNYIYPVSAISDIYVSNNMTKIIQAGSSSEYPAAYAAINYAPGAAPTTKGKWALPTAGILNSLYNNLNAINNTISKLGGTQVTNVIEYIWSSSEYGSDSVWVFCLGCDDGISEDSKDGNSSFLKGHTVRPVLAF